MKLGVHGLKDPGKTPGIITMIYVRPEIIELYAVLVIWVVLPLLTFEKGSAGEGLSSEFEPVGKKIMVAKKTPYTCITLPQTTDSNPTHL